MEKDQEVQPGSSDTGSHLSADTTKPGQFNSESERPQSESSGQSVYPASNTCGQGLAETETESERGDGETESRVAGAMNGEESLTDRLVSMALQGGDESDKSDDDDDGDFLSVSGGESDDEKMRAWGDTLPEPVDTDSALSPRLLDTTSPSRETCNTADAEGGGDKDRPLEPPESAAAVEGDDEGGGDNGGDGGSGEGDKEEEKVEETEADRERERREAEDALTEEERQVGGGLC